jgi:hypothetical protein
MGCGWRRFVLAVGLGACGAPSSDDEALPWPDASALPNPIEAEMALLPWPSDQYLVEDATTRTQRRVSIDPSLLPEDLPPSWFEGHDGFSRVAPIVTWFAGGVDPSSLPDPADWGATLDVATSPILLLRADGDGTPEAVPLLAEVDADTTDVGHAPLLLRAHRALAPSARYVVVIRSGLRDAAGQPLPRDPATVRLLADDPGDDPAMQAWAVHFHLIRDVLERAGVDAGEVVQAWSFSTRSEAQVIERAIATQDVAAAAPLGAYTLEAPVYEADRVTIRGALTVPNFLDAETRLHLDDQGAPIENGTTEAPFLITIPATVTERRTTMLFGHGFFSSIEEPTWGNLFDGIAQWQTPTVTTEFFGFSEDSLSGAITILLGDLARLDTIIDQQLQSHANFTLVHRLITERLADELTIDWGAGAFTPLSADNVPYMGISNGGTQGLVMMTTSPVLDRGGLVVAGGGWSHMLQRASQWTTLGAGISGRWDDPRDMQLALSLLQQVFDPADSLNYVDHLIRDRLPGRPEAPDLLLVEALQDAQVANLVTDWVAGTAGFPLMTPSPVDVWGLTEIPAPLPNGADSRVGMTVYDLGLPPNPAGNVPPTENGAHGDVRLLPSYRAQMGAFLETGALILPCDGPCDPE